MLSIGQIAPKGLKKEKNDDCVTAGKLKDDIPSRIYLFRLGLHFVPGLQSAVCSLQSAFCTDRFVVIRSKHKAVLSCHWS